MKARLLILIALAAGLAVYFAVAKNRAPVVTQSEIVEDGDMTEDEIKAKREEQSEVCTRPLPGKEPSIPPELAVTVEVDRSSGKNRLVFHVTEKHGYYVETFRIQAWYKRPGVTAPEDSPFPWSLYVDNYLKANETFRICGDITQVELSRIGGDMGTSENWDARITWHCRAREKNPDQFPVVTQMDRCR